VWDAETGRDVLSLKGHGSAVFSVAYSPNGKRIVSCSWDHTVKVWDAETGKQVLNLKGHEGTVHHMTYSPDGKRICGRDGTYKVLTWDATTGGLIRDARPVALMKQFDALSPDGTQRAFIEHYQLKVVFLAEQRRRQARDRAFLVRLARPDPAYHRQRADEYEKSGDLFGAAFHLRRLLLIEAKDDLRQRLTAVESKLSAQARLDAKMRQKAPAKMPYAR
jgi:hypothetical protein